MHSHSTSKYNSLSDRDLVAAVLDGDEEAMLYLMYERYYDDLRFYAWRYYGNFDYLDDLVNYLYMQFKGKNADWQPLRNFQWRCTFRTWFSSVASHLFLEKKSELMEYEALSEQEPEPENEKAVMLMEALSRMQNDDYRFVLIKELEGYNHKEIAEMLDRKRARENRTHTYKGQVVVPNAQYVDMVKSRAVRELKAVVEQVKKEWYGNN